MNQYPMNIKCNQRITDRKILTKYIAAFLLGDGCVHIPYRHTNAAYALGQIKIHEDYVMWQADILSNLTSVNIHYKPAYIQSQGAQAKESLYLHTGVLPFFTTIRERFYIQGRKTISPHDLKLFDWETAAIWYMDDGYIEVQDRLTKEKYVRVRICTDCFSYGDVVLLQKVIYEKLGIAFSIRRRKLKSSYGYRLEARTDNAKRFLDGVSKYTHPSFQYKIDYTLVTTQPKYVRIGSEEQLLSNKDDEMI